MDIVKSTFLEKLPVMLAAIEESDFIAIDEEMTGISFANTTGRTNNLYQRGDTASFRYSKVKGVPERFSVIEVGVACFKKKEEGEGGGYVCTPFNIYLFPQNSNGRDIILSASATNFLNDHGLDFNKWIGEGIPFVTEGVEEKLLSKFVEKFPPVIEASADDEAVEVAPAPERVEKKSDIVLTRPSDIQFCATVLAELREWLDAQNPPDQNRHTLPKCNAYLRRYLYGEIGNAYPHLVLTSENNAIIALRLSADEKIQRTIQIRKDAQEKLDLSIGFKHVYNALSARSKEGAPIVVHNGQMDLLFLMSHCHSNPLPEKWSDCRAIIHDKFPNIVDTKYFAHECVTPNSYSSTALGELFEKVAPEDGYQVSLAAGYDKYETTEAAHEAGYDAYMTGCIFAEFVDGMNCDYEKGLNKLYQMRCIYDVDLTATNADDDNSQELLGNNCTADTVIYVGGFTNNYKNTDFTQHFDPLFQQNCEMNWVDNHNLYICVSKHVESSMLENGLDKTVDDVVDELLEKLQNAFQECVICTLREKVEMDVVKKLKEEEDELELAKIAAAAQSGGGGFFSRLANLFGGKRSSEPSDDEAKRKLKRQRTD
jgi:hypothetical protein